MRTCGLDLTPRFPSALLPSKPLQVPDVENPEFFKRMDRMVGYNNKIIEIGQMDLPTPLKNVMRLPYIERMIAEVFQSFIAKPLETGSVDIQTEQQLVY